MSAPLDDTDGRLDTHALVLYSAESRETSMSVPAVRSNEPEKEETSVYS